MQVLDNKSRAIVLALLRAGLLRQEAFEGVLSIVKDALVNGGDFQLLETEQGDIQVKTIAPSGVQG